jgi:hypothetical protein
MKIKNTKVLRARARWHHKQDHIAQGFYGECWTNGEQGAKVCAIGCLATPHTRKGLRAWVRSIGEQPYVEGEWRSSEEGQDQVKRLAKEFGIHPMLARASEAVFEYILDEREAIDFVRDFALALPEGVDIGAAQLKPAWAEITDGAGYMASDGRYNALVRGRWESRLSSLSSDLSASAEEGGQRLIAWLKTFS